MLMLRYTIQMQLLNCIIACVPCYGVHHHKLTLHDYIYNTVIILSLMLLHNYVLYEILKYTVPIWWYTARHPPAMRNAKLQLLCEWLMRTHGLLA